MAAFLAHCPASDQSVGADVLVVPVSGSPSGLYDRIVKLGKGVAESVLRAIDLGDFGGQAGERLLVHTRRQERFPRALLLGLGETETPPPAEIRMAFAAAARNSLPANADSVAVWCGRAFGTGARLGAGVAAAVDGLSEGAYRWTAASQTNGVSAPGRFLFLGETGRLAPRIEQGIREGKALGEGVSLARDLANTPANRMSPHELGDRARALAEDKKMKARVLEGPALVRERCEGILAVGAGSSRDPRLIVLDYAPRGTAKQQPIALVGKGLVFDTGGLNIKPGSSMVEMKFDKCGACVVLGAMSVIADWKLPVRVVAVVPAVENSISGDSYRPGDVIGTRSGKTVEVLNTDAEGRIVLADALDYAITKFDPRAVVDAATLTGAAYYALGDRACAVLGNDDFVVDHLVEAGERVGERAWELPLWSEYLEDVRTPNADVRNTGAFGAGTIAGAAFLEAFVQDVPWGHLDIASVSRDRRDTKVGATGFGVRLIAEAVRSWPKPRRGA